jgi:hypothetical protein
MAVTINSGSTPPLAEFQSDLLKIAEVLSRGQNIGVQLAPGTITHLKSIGLASLSTSIVAT